MAGKSILKIAIPVFVVFVLVASLVLTNTVSLTFFNGLSSGTSSPTNTSKTVNSTTPNRISPLKGPLLVIHVVNYSYSGSSTIQVMGSYYENASAGTPQILQTTIYGSGTYKFLLPPKLMINISKSYEDHGFGGPGNEASLTLMMNENSPSAGGGYFNNIQFSPYSILHSYDNMSVNGNKSYLDHWFQGTYFYPEVYTQIYFIDYSMNTSVP